MNKISIKPVWSVHNENGQLLSPRLLQLLADVQEYGTLAGSCKASGASYRHAWSLIKQGEDQLGMPLLHMRQGKGSKLTPSAEKLAWVGRRIQARLTPMLDSLAAELEAELTDLFHPSADTLKVYASHGFAIEKLIDTLIKTQHPVERRYMGSQESVQALSHNECHLAGFHIPQGEFEQKALSHYLQWLDTDKSRLIHVATRRQGLMIAAGNPLNIQSVADLVRPEVRFINRQPSSGTRFLLECFLQENGIDPAQITHYNQTEFTHAAIAAHVASGMADVGMGIETPSQRFKLDFIPLATERYFLLCHKDKLDSPVIQEVLQIMRSDSFQHAVNELAGYSAKDCGQVQTINEAFQQLPVLGSTQ
jgi:molybdate transport repressor ModE-like protein